MDIHVHARRAPKKRVERVLSEDPVELYLSSATQQQHTENIATTCTTNQRKWSTPKKAGKI